MGYCIPIAQSDVTNGVRIAVRTRGEPAAAASFVRSGVTSRDGDLAIYEINTLRWVTDRPGSTRSSPWQPKYRQISSDRS